MIIFQKYTYLYLILFTSSTMVSCQTSKKLIAVNSKAAPAAIGPYSQAIKTDNLIFCSGQIGLSPTTGQLVGNDITSQTTQALENIKFVLEEAGSDFSNVSKVTIFITDIANYSKVNEIYALYFKTLKPARSVVQVAGLPKEALIEIECVAITK